MCVVTLYKIINYDYSEVVYQTFYSQDNMETRKDAIDDFKKMVNIPSFGFDETRFIHGLSNVLWYRIESFFESESYYLVLESFQGEE